MSGSERPKTSRRDFAKTLAVLAATAPLLDASVVRAAPAAAVSKTGVRRPADAARERPPETDALMEVVRHRYGEHVSDEQLERIDGGVAGTLRRAGRMREEPLDNGEGPAFVFSAYRKGSDDDVR